MTTRMPAAFIGHGNPMHAVRPNRYTEAWADFGRSVPRPRAILVISAHWYTNATAVTGDHKIAFAAFQDSTDTGKWTYPFLGADGYANGTEYFYVTGPAHASGKGQLYTSALAHVAGDVAAPAGGSTTAVIRMGNLATFGIYFGTGAPTVSAAKGSLYLRRDGTTTNNRAYINTDGGTTWTALTTAA